MLCKDRVFETFRSLYTQRPTQSSVLRRIFGFNAEVTEYARISRIASCDHNMLAQEGIVERIPDAPMSWEENAGHLLSEDAPARLLAEILNQRTRT